MSALTAEEKTTTLGTLTKITSIPSLIGSLIILYRFYYSPKAAKRNLSQKIIMYIAVADVIFCINFIIGPSVFGNHTLCAIQGFIIQMDVAAPLWNVALVTNILLRLVFGMNVYKANSLEPLYHILAWGIPAIGGIIGLAQDRMVPVGGWCWFDATAVGLRFGFFYGEVFFAIFYNIAVAVVVVLYIRRTEKRVSEGGMTLATADKKAFKAAKNQLYYVAAFLITFGPGALNRLIQLGGQSYFGLQCIQAFVFPLQGFLNCIIYLTLQKVSIKTLFFAKSLGSGSQKESGSQGADKSIKEKTVEIEDDEDL